jgi:hypothetical protein
MINSEPKKKRRNSLPYRPTFKLDITFEDEEETKDDHRESLTKFNKNCGEKHILSSSSSTSNSDIDSLSSLE